MVTRYGSRCEVGARVDLTIFTHDGAPLPSTPAFSASKAVASCGQYFIVDLALDLTSTADRRYIG